METHSADDIRRQLMLFGQAVDASVRALADDPDPVPGLVSAPYPIKCRIRDMLSLSGCSDNSCTAFGQEYCRIAKRLDVLADEYGQRYRDLLMAGLREMIHAYHAGTCYSHIGLPADECDPVLREAISELFAQLRGYYDLSAMERFIEVVDENAVNCDTSVMGNPAKCLQSSPGLPASVTGSIHYPCHQRDVPASLYRTDEADDR